MARTKNAERIIKHKDKKVLNEVSIEQMFDFLQREDEDTHTSRMRRLMEEHYKDAIDQTSKTSYSSRTDFLDRVLGKAKETKDITSGGKSISSVVFDILENDSIKE